MRKLGINSSGGAPPPLLTRYGRIQPCASGNAPRHPQVRPTAGISRREMLLPSSMAETNRQIRSVALQRILSIHSLRTMSRIASC